MSSANAAEHMSAEIAVAVISLFIRFPPKEFISDRTMHAHMLAGKHSSAFYSAGLQNTVLRT